MNEEYLRELVKLTKVSSEPTINAVVDHVCNGLVQEKAAEKHGVKQEAVARLTKRLVKLDELVTNLHKLK